MSFVCNILRTEKLTAQQSTSPLDAMINCEQFWTSTVCYTHIMAQEQESTQPMALTLAPQPMALTLAPQQRTQALLLTQTLAALTLTLARTQLHTQLLSSGNEQHKGPTHHWLLVYCNWSTPTPFDSRTFTFYPRCTKGGRPIVSKINSTTYHTSKYLHNVLVQVLPYLGTVVKSTQHALTQLLRAKLPQRCVILCADVTSLYPSIPIAYGLAAVRSVLEKFTAEIKGFPKINIDLTLELLRWVLTNNYFSYMEETYLQLTGTAMGTPLAVMYAIIVLFYLESVVPSPTARPACPGNGGFVPDKKRLL